MLHDFITLHRDDIITRTRSRVVGRPWPAVSPDELRNGVPLFLTQLSDTLRRETTARPATPDTAMAPSAIGPTAARHGRDLLARGFTISQVVHDYGDICQVITELALEEGVPMTTTEFHILNRCLDTAIAEAVTEHARLSAEHTLQAETERIGRIAHELRNNAQTALLAFQVLKGGTVAINGSTGGVLGRSLSALQSLVDGALCEVRLASSARRHDRISVQEFFVDIATSASLLAEFYGVALRVDPVDHDVAVTGDWQLLSSGIMNLVQNGLKFTPRGGEVLLSARHEDNRLLISVEDQCGGLSDVGELFGPVGERRATARSGLGLGLSIVRNAVKAHGGELAIRNSPGRGCVFTAALPLHASTPRPYAAVSDDVPPGAID